MEDRDWVEIGHKETGCSATLGYYGPGAGAHVLNLQRGEEGWTCVAKSVVIHEALHLLGVQHEQCRPDRDQFIMIHWSKMEVTPGLAILTIDITF